MARSVIINSETDILLNKVKAEILRRDPAIKKLTNTIAIRKALIAYLGGENGRRKTRTAKQ